MYMAAQLEFLSAQGLLAEEMFYTIDEDGVMQIHQENMHISLTPRQCLDLRELLTTHLDVLDYVRSVK